jgi:hypothetical protein
MLKQIHLKFYFIVLTTLVITLKNAFSQKSDLKENKQKTLVLTAEHVGPVINETHKDVLATNNKSGFETGQVIKLEGVYHMFVNEMFDRPHRDLRVSYWTSTDAVNWNRQSTIVQSIPGRTHTNPRSEVWVTAVIFNEEENAWNIFYVAYRGGDASKGEIEGADYAGRIWRAKSVVHGLDGIAGPYADIAIVLQPDQNSQAWEGQQAVASFNPYKAGDKWYSFYDGHTHLPIGPWPTGLAVADNLNGPWTRMPEPFNPLKIVDIFMENPVTSRLKDGRYLIVFDSFGDQEIGYSTSTDGVNWEKEIRVKIQTDQNKWSDDGDHAMRTPLCAIEEADGTFTVIYTAKYTRPNGLPFFGIGKCTLGWK